MTAEERLKQHEAVPLQLSSRWEGEGRSTHSTFSQRRRGPEASKMISGGLSLSWGVIKRSSPGKLPPFPTH